MEHALLESTTHDGPTDMANSPADAGRALSGGVPIAFLIITKDEEKNLPFSLATIADWAREIFVLDSGSTDRTREIAESFGAQFHYRKWDGYVRQKNWGLEN